MNTLTSRNTIFGLAVAACLSAPATVGAQQHFLALTQSVSPAMNGAESGSFLADAERPLATPGIAATSETQSGASVYTIELDSAPLSLLQTAGSRFAYSEAMTVGISALVPANEVGVREYVLWLRHDGPENWYIGAEEQPLTIQLKDRRLLPLPLHIAATGATSNPHPRIETLEFSLVPELVEILLNEPSVVLKLDTRVGQLQKPLHDQLIDALQQLDHQIVADVR